MTEQSSNYKSSEKWAVQSSSINSLNTILLLCIDPL